MSAAHPAAAAKMNLQNRTKPVAPTAQALNFAEAATLPTERWR
jgi:hypothetical protein